ncbi:MAG: transcriptional regulator, partial [Reyranellaceae bacterium]
RMTTVTLCVVSRDDVNRHALAAFESVAQGAHISFASAELLRPTLTPKRCTLLKAMTAQGPMTIREAARRVAREVKAVHTDVHCLLASAIPKRIQDGRIVFSLQRGA